MTALHDRAVRTTDEAPAPVTRAGVAETLRLTGTALAPMLARGIILRRPTMVRLADRLQLDDRAVRALQRRRRRHGDGPLLLRIPGRRVALVLSARDVGRVLAEGPTPFSPASREKRAALQHFQPRGVLISPPEDRPARRSWNEAALQIDVPLHAQAASVAQIAAQELSGLRTAGRWDWDAFAPAWWRVVRRVTLGDAARDDEALTDLLGRLRSRANWAFLRRTDGPARARLLRRIDAYVQAAEPGSLAATVAALPADPAVPVADQVAHWLFAWDAAGIATHRTVALLAGHPAHGAAVAAEVAAADPGTPDLPLLRATVLESLRLWPTTLAVLRESTQDTDWAGTTLPAGTTFVVPSSLAHRDDEVLPDADRFAPQLWADDDAPGGTSASLRSMVPFSAGPARCPGRDLVLYSTGVALSTLVAGHRVVQVGGRRVVEGGPLPRTLDHTALAYALSPA